MAYEAYVLLPGDSTWPDLPVVRVQSRSDVDKDLQSHAPDATQQLHLQIAGEDLQLEQSLQEVGEVALRLDGIALDARSLRPLVSRPRPARAPAPDDPGPVWEHLPGVGLTSPASGAVIDAFPALEHLTVAMAGTDEHTIYEQPVEQGPPGGFAILARAAREVRGHGGRFAIVCMVSATIGALAGAFASTEWLQPLTVLFPGVLVPWALVPGGVHPARRWARLVLGSAAIVLLIVVPFQPPVVSEVLDFVSPLLFAVPAAMWMGLSAKGALASIARLGRRRAVSILFAWVSLGLIIAIPSAVIMSIIGFDQVESARAIGMLALTIALTFTTSIAMVATEWIEPSRRPADA